MINEFTEFCEDFIDNFNKNNPNWPYLKFNYIKQDDDIWIKVLKSSHHMKTENQNQYIVNNFIIFEDKIDIMIEDFFMEICDSFSTIYYDICKIEFDTLKVRNNYYVDDIYVYNKYFKRNY